MKIQQKLNVSYLALTAGAVFAIGTLLWGLVSLRRLQYRVCQAQEQTRVIMHLETLMARQVRLLTQFGTAPEAGGAQVDRWANCMGRVDTALDAWEASIVNELATVEETQRSEEAAEIQELAALRDLQSRLVAAGHEVRRLQACGDVARARVLLNETLDSERLSDLERHLTCLVAEEEDEVGEAEDRAEACYARLQAAAGASAGSVVLLAWVCARQARRRIVEPLRRLERATVALREGRRDIDLAITSRDELGKLAASIEAMSRELDASTVSLDDLRSEVAERRRTEAALEAANRELKEFAYVVSHDLKAPLRGIKTLVDWISQDHAERLDDEGREHLRLLGTRAERMRNLIEGVLQYSRVGRVREDLEAVDLNELVAETLDLLAVPESVQVTVEGSLPTVEAEPTRIAQVFQNLIGNAVKYMDKPEGRVWVGCVEEEAHWRFHVADNGPGIDAAHFETIFRIFQTLQSKDTYESTGIGLSLVKKIVEGRGGRVWLSSEPGQGTTFYFTYPRQPRATAEPARSVAAESV